ncbi:16S rRNA (cytosine(1402)-N(4))-methyltransferase RsmH [Taibaiella soli]|uniref:Ribosomal RNA small subunit methyltransferase H n=1 Tax=Taibaiella soli TaxID=1649169 RepID=A0A2W2AFP5_9BACT|nr:16S rRNA (cytosine(1402)-N(4))-methyltransferase RsmH [Taibaiella soli]PZF72332.1 16S rRNA (cytosine(1402)-N(4))-methyltransferase [Taibaiella soli]
MEESAFYHTTVLLNEAVDGLAIKPDGVYVDATFGGGGHSRLILEKLGPDGKLISFDQDADAWRNKPDDARLIPVTENFRYMRKFLRLHGNPQVDGILADLGVSSYQFDTAERGFSIRFDGPLDMRMDQRTEKTAAGILKTYSEGELHKLFEQYGEVRNAKQLAKHIVSSRDKMQLTTIDSLKAMIAPVMKGNPNRYLAQLFQALRIEVNDEMGALRDLLEQSVQCLKPEGRLSVITFHSLEDRLVKQFMKKGKWEETVDMFGRVTEPAQLKPLTPKPIEPTEEEQKNNPRSRSARLRIAEKLA